MALHEREYLGNRIADARRRAGITQVELASAVSLDRSAIAKIENGTRRVSALELARIADAVGERIEWFLKPTPTAIISHRNLQDPGAASPSIDKLVEQAARNAEFVASRGDFVWRNSRLLDRPASVNETEDCAAEARELLGLNATEPLLNVSSSVAELGLLAFSFDMGPDAADAASVLLANGGVAIVNGSLRVGRRRLALAHELGHYLFADEYTVDWRISEQESDDDWEARLDRFARALLLPRRGLQEELARLTGKNEDLRTIAVKLGSLYGVDMSTLARRLLDLRLIDQQKAGFLRTVRTTRGDIVALNLLVQREMEPPFLPPLYVKSVLTLYRKAVVSAARALDLLFDTWNEDDLPELPRLPEKSIWNFV